MVLLWRLLPNPISCGIMNGSYRPKTDSCKPMYRCFVTISSQGASPETIVSRGVPNKSECNQGNLPADCNYRHNSGVLMAIFSYCICNHLLLDLANIKPRAFVCALTMGGTVTGHSIGRLCARCEQRLFDATQLLWQTADFKPDPFFQICLKCRFILVQISHGVRGCETPASCQ